MRRLLAILAVCVFCSCIVQAQTAPLILDQGTPVADPDSWQKATLIRLGSQLSALQNQFQVVLQSMSNSTGNVKGGIMKGNIIAQFVQTEDTDWVAGSSKLAVPMISYGAIGGGIQHGQLWGFNTMASIWPGSDGWLMGAEIDVDNNGSDQPGIGLQNSKYGMSLVCGQGAGSKPCTSAMTVNQGTSTWHAGIQVWPGALTDPVNSPAFAMLDSNGANHAAILGDGTVIGRFVWGDGIINTATLDPKLLPTMRPNEFFYWGDRSTGQSYFAFFDGQGYALIPTVKYIKPN
jgi:hypothetical protein